MVALFKGIVKRGIYTRELVSKCLHHVDMIKHASALLNLDGQDFAPHKEDIGQTLLLVNVA